MDLVKVQKFIKTKEFGKALNILLELEKKDIYEEKILFYLGLVYFVL